jgi:bifunctional DNA-binding transcriptional regulator/antitoxin component of YhaV-PrlF toxin-antitoxin module
MQTIKAEYVRFLMAVFVTHVRDRGVTVVPAELRQTADVQPDSELTWVEIGPRLWLVGPREQHPEEAAPSVAAALLVERSQFPKIMRRVLTGEIPQRVGRGRRRVHAPRLTEEDMSALGTPAGEPARRRGRR